MIPYACLKPGPGFSPMRAAAYYSQRLAVVPAVRTGVTSLLAMVINATRGRKPLKVSPSLREASSTLRTDGLITLPPYPAAMIDRLIEKLQTAKVVAPNGSLTALDALSPGAVSAAYPMATVLSVPEVLEIANNPFVLSVAQTYLGCRPTLSSLGIRWSLPTAGIGNDVQLFHRDMDDWRSVKFFVYLTDVTADTGPHIYVRGSHRSRGRLRARPYSFAEVVRRFGHQAITPIVGPRGTAFLADVYGIHRGVPPDAAPRLILQIQYSVLPIYAFAYSKQSVPLPESSDRYMYRLLIH